MTKGLRLPRLLRACAAGLLLWAAALGCGTTDVAPPPSSDPARQCQPQSGCSGNLLCVSLYPIKIISDGGVVQVMNYTCHQSCDTAQCPSNYGCYTLPAAQNGMQKVCVQSKVLDTISSSRDGG